MSAEETKTRILAAVTPVFAAYGFEGASTRTLAQAASVNIATLAYHFGDKQGLYDALVDDIYTEILAFDLLAGADNLDQPARLQAVVAALFRFACARRARVAILLRHVLDRKRLPPALAARYLPAIQVRLQAIMEVLEIPYTPENFLTLLSLNHLIVRHALTSPEDWALFLADVDIEGVVADHLGQVACKMLGVGARDT